jgi:hypothetical protein
LACFQPTAASITSICLGSGTPPIVTAGCFVEA